MRRCIVCRRRRPKNELIRLKSVEQTVKVVSSPRDNTPGRGCYVCPDQACKTKALNKTRLERALRTTITVAPSQDAIFAGI